MPENWMPIKGYESLYLISDWGRVKALEKWVDLGMGRKQFHEEKIKTAPISKANGYHMIQLQTKGKLKGFTIHRLVASHFLPTPTDEKAIINHRDGNKLNNHIDNLEWSTYTDNIKHAYSLKLRRSPWGGKFGKEHYHSKTVLQFDKNGNFLKEWGSTKEVARELSITQQCVSAACRRLYNQSYKGFTWKYKDNG